MNKIKELIDRQLGELPEVQNSNGSFNFSYVQKNINNIPLYFNSNKVHFREMPYQLWCEMYIKEMEKRELLEMLIEIAYAEYREFTTTEKNQMKLIEKNLKMKWKEIIAQLED